MKKFFAISLIFFCTEVFAQATRYTSFDDRPDCEESKGVWRQFGNVCVDQCRPKFDQFVICAQAITFGCDCGDGRCWEGNSCIPLKDYKKTFDAEVAEEKKILDEAKERRKEEAKENEQLILNRLANPVLSEVGVPPSTNSVNQIQSLAPAITASTNSQPQTAQEAASQSSQIMATPFFLKQEQVKQSATQAAQPGSEANKSEANPLIPPGLPEIPLPN